MILREDVGGVYFVQAGEDGPIKIGISGELETRMKGLQSGSGYRLKVLTVIDGTSETEKNLHKKWRENHLHGEWFTPSEELYAAIINLDKTRGNAKAKAVAQAAIDQCGAPHVFKSVMRPADFDWAARHYEFDRSPVDGDHYPVHRYFYLRFKGNFWEETLLRYIGRDLSTGANVEWLAKRLLYNYYIMQITHKPKWDDAVPADASSPSCPVCGNKMELKEPRANQDWSPFWGCLRFPRCRGTRQIPDDGLPITYEEWQKKHDLDAVYLTG